MHRPIQQLLRSLAQFLPEFPAPTGALFASQDETFSGRQPKSCQAFLVRKIAILLSPQRRWRVGCGAEKFWPEDTSEAKVASTEKEEVPERQQKTEPLI